MKIWQDSMAGQKKKSQNSLSNLHVCEYCDKGFVRETTLAAHNCEPKRRMAQQNEAGVRIAHQCFIQFYQHIRPTDKEKSYREFIDSPYYLAFVKFGRYCVEVKVIAPAGFCAWLLKNNKKLDNWCRDSLYEEFLLEYIKLEPAAPALERSIRTMTEWAEENQARYQDYFKYATNNRICFDIQSGWISPWVVYISDTGKDFLGRLHESDVTSIWNYIDSDFWDRNFLRRPADAQWAKDILTQAGI